MQRYKDLKVWQRSHAFVLAVYKLTAKYPTDERFGLTNETRRSARSVPSNIVEGTRRKSNRDYAHFLNIAEGSLAEAEYQLLLGRDLGYVTQTGVAALITEADEIGAMLYRFRIKVEQGGQKTEN